jgi:hypothetical protein
LRWEGGDLRKDFTADAVACTKIRVVAKVYLKFDKGVLVLLPRFIDATVVRLLEIVLYTNIGPTTELCATTPAD